MKLSPYPDKMGSAFFLGLEEVLGREGVRSALQSAHYPDPFDPHQPNRGWQPFDFSRFSELQAALETLYGPSAGQGLALKSGRAGFKYLLNEYGEQTGLTRLSFRVLPFDEKIEKGTDLTARLLQERTDYHLHLTPKEEVYRLEIERCPVCRGRQAEAPACYWIVGLLQEALYWLSGGKSFGVKETSCSAKGDPACVFEIDKQPFA